METYLQTCGIAALYVCNMLAMYVLAWLFTEVITLPWKVKPFNCRECLAFWLTFIGGIVLSFIVDTPECAPVFSFVMLHTVSFLTGIINYSFIKSKFKIYD